MAFSLAGVSKFLKNLSFLDSFGLVESGLNLALTIFDYAREDWTEEPSNTEVLDKIAALSDKIDTVAPAVIGAVNDLVNDQAIGIRMQQLASALSGAQSARDLLASYQPGDEIMRAAIIVESSAAFRDTLAQATSIITPTEFYKPSFAAVNTVMASVFQALSTRLAVASVLENDEMVADKISNQVEDAADFIENAILVYRATMETRVSEFTLDNTTGTTLYNFVVELDIETPEVEISDGQFVPGPPYRLETTLQAFQFTTTSGQLADMEKQLEDQVFADLNMGVGGISLSDLANDYRAMVAGVEKSLPLLIGHDSSGTLTGTSSGDLLIGNVGDDTLYGKAGNDLLKGKAGDDSLLGEGGNDRLIGGDGNDVLFGNSGDDALEGNGGNDTIYGDEIYSGASNLTALAIVPQGYDKARFYGQRSDYTVTHVSSEKTLLSITPVPDGSGGFTYVNNFGYTTTLKVTGPDGTDIVVGIEELVFDNDTVLVKEGTAARDIIVGEDTGDFIFGWDGDDVLVGFDGNDTIKGGLGKDAVFGGAGNDSLFGGKGRDILVGSAGKDMLFGEGGKDRLKGAGGDDILKGGNGNDKLFGAYGNDKLLGGKGNDLLSAGAGNDNLTGNSGNDTFLFDLGQGENEPPIGNNVITDFKKGTDILQLDDRIWLYSDGVLTVSEVLTRFATDTGADIVLDFGGGQSITLLGVANMNGLESDVQII